MSYQSSQNHSRIGNIDLEESEMKEQIWKK